MSKERLLQIANVLFLVATIIMNGLSQNRDLFPNTIGELGESRAVFFLPAGYVFAIWGIIYIGIIGFAIYQARPIAVKNGVLEKVSFWFILSCIGNSVWLVLFLYNLIWLSTLAMLLILVSLIMIYQRLEIGKRPVDWQEHWAVHIPFSVYLGWISVATVANLTVGFYELGQTTSLLGIGADIWAILMMLVAGALGFIMLWQRRDIAYALVIVWALVGIYARPFDTGVFTALAALQITWVHMSALIIALAVGLGVLARSALSLQKR